MFAAGAAQAQTSTGTVSGVVADATGAPVPGAQIVLRNSKSRDQRKTSSNSTATTALPSFLLPPTPSRSRARDFRRWSPRTSKLSERPAQPSRVVPECRCGRRKRHRGSKHGHRTSGERSTLIRSRDIAKLATVGRDVSELLRTQAGFSQVQAGLDNSSNSSAEVAGGYSGLNNYVGNGATANGASVISDGANVTDPGTVPARHRL